MRIDLRSAAGSNWPIKVTALALATVLWAAVAAEEPTTQLVPVRVDIQTPPNRTLVQEIPQVQALYEGRARELIRLYMSPPFVRKIVPDTLSDSFYTLDISPQDVRLATDANVVLQEVVPRRLVIALDSVDRRAVPVVPRVSIHTDSGFVPMGPVVSVPDSVMVIGPEAQVRRIGSVFTVPLELSNVRGPVRRTVAIDTSAFGVVRLSQTEVEIDANVEELSERILVGVPVEIQGGMWESDPATVQVLVRGPTSRLRALTTDSVTVTAPAPVADGVLVALAVRAPAGLSTTVTPDSVRAQRMIL